LKHLGARPAPAPAPAFLYIDPLKQGLKPISRYLENSDKGVFIHRSIKTRIETYDEGRYEIRNSCFYT